MTDQITFKINHEKCIEAVLYVIDALKGSINKYNLMKVIFEADKYHLNNHARPVTGDTYIAMEYGTVPSAIKNYIDRNHWYLELINREEFPFKLDTSQHLVKSDIKPNLDFLSETDKEALDIGIKKYGTLPFKEVERLNHEEECWIKTRELNPDRSIPFELMISNEEIKEYLAEHSKFIVI
jgi:uncharacterized phage-associated protein